MTYADQLFLQLGWSVKCKRPDLRELISECSAANIDFLLWNGNNKLKPKCFPLHDPPPLPTKEAGYFNVEIYKG